MFAPKSKNGGQIDDWQWRTGIGKEDKVSLQTGSYNSEDNNSEYLGAKAKFMKYFSFALVTGTRRAAASSDECNQICMNYSDKCCASFEIVR